MNADGSSTNGNNNNGNGNNNDDGRGTDASDDWKMNSPFDDGTDGAATAGTGDASSAENAGIDNNAGSICSEFSILPFIPEILGANFAFSHASPR